MWFAFDQNWNITAAFKGVYPAGSMYVDRYYVSWNVAVPCRSFNEMYDPLASGACVVTQSCSAFATSLSSWDVAAQFTLNTMGKCLNVESS